MQQIYPNEEQNEFIYRRSADAIMKHLTVEQIAARAYFIGFQDALSVTAEREGGSHVRP